jgi:hypothetical protein
MMRTATTRYRMAATNATPISSNPWRVANFVRSRTRAAAWSIDSSAA